MNTPRKPDYTPLIGKTVTLGEALAQGSRIPAIYSAIANALKDADEAGIAAGNSPIAPVEIVAAISNLLASQLLISTVLAHKGNPDLITLDKDGFDVTRDSFMSMIYEVLEGRIAHEVATSEVKNALLLLAAEGGHA